VRFCKDVGMLMQTQDEEAKEILRIVLGMVKEGKIVKGKFSQLLRDDPSTLEEMSQPNWGIEYGIEPLPIRTTALPLAHTSPVERTASPVATAVPSALKGKKRAAPDVRPEDDAEQPTTKKPRVADGKRAAGTWKCDICG
jgi:hypothetical protein